MIKLLFKGLLFGAGFIISIVIALFVTNKYFEKDIEERNKQLSSFRELTVNQRINTSEKLFVINYQQSDTKKRIASIAKILIKNEDATREYSEGDLFSQSDYYPLSDLENRSATVLLFINDDDDHPAATWHVYNDVIPALGNMPLELMIKEFYE
jgi:hypothetical protein